MNMSGRQEQRQPLDVTTTSAMEPKLESEEIYAYGGEKVSPGWVYDAAAKEYSPGEDTLCIRVEDCPPSWKVDIKKNAELSKLATSEIIRNHSMWFQDFEAKQSGYAMLLQGSKTIEKKGLTVEPHPEKSIVASVHYISSIEILMFFKSPIDDKADIELHRYIDDTLANISPIMIPPLIYDPFLNAYIYERGNRTEITSLKHGLQEFCRYLVESEVSKFPHKTTVLKPTQAPPPVVPSYASVAKNESGKIRAESQHTSHNSHWTSHSTGQEIQPNYPSSSTRNAGTSLPAVHGDQQNCHGHSGCYTTLVHNYAKNEESKCSGFTTPEKVYDLRSRKGKPLLLDDGKKQRPTSLLLDQECKVKGDKVKATSVAMDEESDNSCISNTSFERTGEKIKGNIFHKPSSKNCSNLLSSDNNTFTQTEECESKLRDLCDQKKVEDESLNIRRVDVNSEQSFTLLTPIEETENCGTLSKYYGVCVKGKGKSVILLGASGSGKTTLVNFIANYFTGINPAKGRLVRVAASSSNVQARTTSIITYTFCANEDDEPLTIIDTPGLNDSSGAEVRDHVQSLKTFLANSGSEKLEIHAIGFVAQAHIVRLTSSERLVMDYVANLFGAEIGDHVVTFVTFADGQEAPPVVEAMKSYGVSCNVFLKFNNSALSNSKDEEVDDLDKIYWRIGCKSWKKFLKHLSKLPPLSLDVLKTLQSEMYVTQIMESAERDLKTELMTLVKYYKEDKRSREAFEARKRVWHLVTCVNQLKFIYSSVNVNVESTLVTYSENVCKETGLSVQPFIVFLSLAPSRALFKAGLGIIQSIAPIYYNVTNSQKVIQAKMNFKLFCHGCQEDHVVERQSVKPSLLQSLGLHDRPVTYSCSECYCSGNLHGEKEEVAHDFCSLHPNYLLQHARNCIEQILHNYCLPGYKVNEKEFIQHLECIVERESQLLCRKLLSIE